jgi:predicted metal-dependent hydrolase
MRKAVMRIVMITLIIDFLKVTLKMLHHDKQLWRWRTVKSMSRFFFSKHGFVRLLIPAYKDFFREDFHPWDEDSRELLKHWQEKLDPIMSAA